MACGCPESIPPVTRTLYPNLLDAVTRAADDDALVFYGTRIRFGMLADLAARLAGWLQSGAAQGLHA